MHKIEEKRSLLVQPELIYKVILDVDSYDEFLPFCSSSKITEKKLRFLIAQLQITFQGMKQEFSSYINHQKINNNFIITIKSHGKILKYLETKWLISQNNSLTKIELFIKCDFKSTIFSWTFALYKNILIKKIIEAFISRITYIEKEQQLKKRNLSYILKID